MAADRNTATRAKMKMLAFYVSPTHQGQAERLFRARQKTEPDVRRSEILREALAIGLDVLSRQGDVAPLADE